MNEVDKMSRYEVELIHLVRRNPKFTEALNRIIAAHNSMPSEKGSE